MYLYDVATIPANLAGIPGMNVPNAVSSEGLPIGFQVLAPRAATWSCIRWRPWLRRSATTSRASCPAANWEEK